jgi:hypothetical protein
MCGRVAANDEIMQEIVDADLVEVGGQRVDWLGRV